MITRTLYGRAAALIVVALTSLGHAAADPRPRLLLAPGQTPATLRRAIRARVAGADPWPGRLLARIRKSAARRAARAPSPTDYRSASTAKAAAFLAFLEGDRTLAGKAAELLARMPADPGRRWSDYIHVSEATIAWLAAYDLLAAAQRPSAAITRRLVGHCAAYHRNVAKQHLGLLSSRLNNHTSKSAAAIGLAGLVLADQPASAGVNPAAWRAFGLDRLRATYARQQTGGGWGEGPKYQEYGALCELPLILALRQTGGPDLLADPALRRSLAWNRLLRMPDGLRPNIDDANYSPFHGVLLAGALRDPAWLWDWQTGAAAGYTGAMPELAVEALVHYPDGLKAAPPTGAPSGWVPGAGHAVLRSGWGDRDLYLLLLGEHGAAHKAGGGHEHPDATSVVVAGRGERFIVDSGYISWPRHALVNKPANHNVMLVDGKGPPVFEPFGQTAAVGDGEGRLSAWLAHAPFVSVRARARYHGVRFSRRALLLDGRLLLLVDTAKGDAPHALDWRLHLHVGGTVGGRLETIQGGPQRWLRVIRRERAALALEVAADAPLTSTDTEAPYGQRFGVVDRVTRWRLAGRAARLRWITLLRFGDADAVFTPALDGPLVGADGRRWTIRRLPGGLAVEAAAGARRWRWAAGDVTGQAGPVRWQLEGGSLALTVDADGVRGQLADGAATLTVPQAPRAATGFGAARPGDPPTRLRPEPGTPFTVRWR